MKKTLLPFLFLVFSINEMAAQLDTLTLSLPEIVELAQSDAPDALLAETRMRNRYWAYQSAMADFKPAITLNGILPDLNRSIQAVTQPDGKDIFLQRAQMRNGIDLSLEQQVLWTGGTVFAGAGLDRLDIFNPDTTNSVSYFSTPIS